MNQPCGVANPAFVAAAFEGGFEEDFHKIQGVLGGGEALAQGEHVGVVVLAGEADFFFVAAIFESSLAFGFTPYTLAPSR